MSPNGTPESVSLGKIILECYVTMQNSKKWISDSHDDDFTRDFLELTFTIFENYKIVISEQNDPICQGCGRGPDAARCGPPNDQKAHSRLW